MGRPDLASSTDPAWPDRQKLEAGRASVARNALVLTAATVVARLSMFAVGIVLARALGAAEFGRYSLALALAVVLQPIADFGISLYLARETARDQRAAEAALGRLALAKLGLLTLTPGVTVAVAAALGTGDEMLALVGAMVVAWMLDGWSIFVFSYFQGRESMSYEARSTTAAGLIRAAGAITLALATESLALVAGWIVLVAAGQAALSHRRLRRAVGRLASARGAHVEWSRVASMGAVSVFVILYLRADTLLIGLFEDDRSVGLYAAAYTVMLGAQIVPHMVTTALQPVFARTYSDGTSDFVETWHDGIRLLLLITVPITVVVVVLAAGIIDRSFGSSFGPSSDVLKIIICICPLVAVSLAAQAVLRGARREGVLVWVSGTCAMVNVGVNLWAIPTFGITGAAWTTLATEALNVALLLWFVISRGLVPPPRLPAVRIGLAATGLAGIAHGLGGWPVELAGLIALASYVVVLIASGVLRGAELARLRRLMRADSP